MDRPTLGISPRMATTLGLPEEVRACLFDLDGVLTDTASVHRKAWKQMFDAFLRARADDGGDRFVAFDVDEDYQTYVDGKKRDDGVRSFLESRGISLSDEEVEELGDRKNELFQKTLHSDGVDVFEGSRRYLEAVSAAGLAVAVVSSSANTREVLDITGLAHYVQVRVDGVTLRDENIAGKPAPDSFLRAAQLLDVPADQAVVFEDAIAGVAAGHAGEFGYVVGVDRVGHAEELRRNGADVVVGDLAELLDARMIDDDAFPIEPWHVRETTLNLDIHRPDRIAFRVVQRPHRDAGEPRGRRAARPARHVSERVLRNPAAAVRGGRVFESRGRAVDTRRHQRQDPATPRRRRAVRCAVRRIVGTRKGFGPARRNLGSRRAVEVACR